MRTSQGSLSRLSQARLHGGFQANLRIDEDGHIGDCVCLAEQEYLNELTLEIDGRRKRLCECRQWSFNSSVRTEDVEVMLGEMAAWLNVRQSSLDAGPPIAEEQKHGYNTMLLRPEISQSSIEYNRVSRACFANLETVRQHREETCSYIALAGLAGLTPDTADGKTDVACHLQLTPSADFPAMSLVEWLEEEYEIVVAAPTDSQPPNCPPSTGKGLLFDQAKLIVDKDGRADWADDEAKPSASQDVRVSSAAAGNVPQAKDPLGTSIIVHRVKAPMVTFIHLRNGQITSSFGTVAR